MHGSYFRRRFWLNVFVATLLVSSQLPVPIANAQYTQQPCDTDVKYWCFMVDWTPQGQGSQTVNWRGHKGGLGGSAAWWRRSTTEDWSYTGSWTFLGSWAQGGVHSGPGMIWDSITSQRWIGGEAVVRLQNKYCNKAPGGGCDGFYWCSPYIDFHLNVVSWVSAGSAGCLNPN